MAKTESSKAAKKAVRPRKKSAKLATFHTVDKVAYARAQVVLLLQPLTPKQRGSVLDSAAKQLIPEYEHEEE